MIANHCFRYFCPIIIFFLIALVAPTISQAGAFIISETLFADERSVVHPPRYVGSGGVLEVNVCINPNSMHASAMRAPMRRAIATINANSPVLGNLRHGSSLHDTPTGKIDFESVALHELGHAIGLAHPHVNNRQDKSFGPSTRFTQSLPGPNQTYDTDEGADAMEGTADDLRGDDTNAHWFFHGYNDPFTLRFPVDATTYSVEPDGLPTDHHFVAIADRWISLRLGHPFTEAVMVQEVFLQEEQRQLSPDDVATMRFAESGRDETHGTPDDYQLHLILHHDGAPCDIWVSLEDISSAAVVNLGLISIGNNHFRVAENTSGEISIHFNQTLPWWFGVSTLPNIFASRFETGDVSEWSPAPNARRIP
ncbi:MAG: hypothetical protein AAF772_07000 [Acidobacteriota bacterium]